MGANELNWEKKNEKLVIDPPLQLEKEEYYLLEKHYSKL